MPDDLAPALAAALYGATAAVPSSDVSPCSICHSGVPAAYERCYPCNEASYFLGGDVPLVLPIALSLDGSQLHHALRQYKDGYDDSVRQRFTMQLAGFLEMFMRRHEQCVGPYDIVTCVPSPRRVAFEAVISRMARFQDTYELLLGAVPTPGTRQLDADRFQARRTLSGERVLIVDDTFTTGASAFSAVAALRRIGASAKTIVVIGRHAAPLRFTPTAELLERMKAAGLAWNQDECVVCRGIDSLF